MVESRRVRWEWYIAYIQNVDVRTQGKRDKCLWEEDIRNITFCDKFITCVTTSTMAQQNPPTKAVANIISTLLANTVKSQEAEKGSDVTSSTLLRPKRMASPPSIPPKKAPRRDRLATQEACCSLTVKIPLDALATASGNRCCCSFSESTAGEL